MKKILFPINFSDHTTEAFKYAADLALFLKAKLVVMHAYNEPEVKMATKEELAEMASETIDKLLAFVEEHLSEDYKKVKVKYVAKGGIAADAILKVALEEEINLIVIGGIGKPNNVNQILGSTVLDVLKKSDCPVLAIPVKAKFQGIDNIVYTVNFEFRDMGAINYLKKWCTAFNTPLHCLHVVEKGENEWNAIKNMKIMKKVYKEHKRLQFQMRAGDFETELHEFVRTKRIDLIAMISHKRNFIGRLLDPSIVNKMAGQVNVPLLIIKDNAYELDASTMDWMTIFNSMG